MLSPLMHFLSQKRIVLASGSPRRKMLLENIGLKIDTVPSAFEENLEFEQFSDPGEYVTETARGKVAEVFHRLKKGPNPPEMVIGADTSVFIDGQCLGKPKNEDMAFSMLSRLSGRSHYVHTGVVIRWRTSGDDISEDSFSTATKVTFATLPRDVILSYIKTGEPMDKAGAYGIQELGASLIESIEGDYFNVVGLPLHDLCQTIRKHYEEEGTAGSW